MTEQALLIRPAEPADRDHVWRLAGELATSFHPEQTAFDASFDKLLATPDTLVLVAEMPRLGVIGYLLANSHLTFFANGPVAWVEEVMVDHLERRTGVGRALMSRAEEWGQAINAAYLSLATRRADDFYLALGYVASASFYRKTLG